jgi:hypothetical protein
MASGEPSTLPKLPQMSPIACDRCGGAAKLTSCWIDSFSRGLREECAYTCAACGQTQTRLFERPPPTGTGLAR